MIRILVIGVLLATISVYLIIIHWVAILIRGCILLRILFIFKLGSGVFGIILLVIVLVLLLIVILLIILRV